MTLDDGCYMLLQVPTFLQQGDVLVLPLFSFKPVIFENVADCSSANTSMTDEANVAGHKKFLVMY